MEQKAKLVEQGKQVQQMLDLMEIFGSNEEETRNILLAWQKLLKHVQ